MPVWRESDKKPDGAKRALVGGWEALQAAGLPVEAANAAGDLIIAVIGDGSFCHISTLTAGNVWACLRNKIVL